MAAKLPGGTLSSVCTYMRVPLCVGVHMDRTGCAFTYLSPDRDSEGRWAWLQFPRMKWEGAGVRAVACALMELEVTHT